jgi:hypothetical protein
MTWPGLRLWVMTFGWEVDNRSRLSSPCHSIRYGMPLAASVTGNPPPPPSSSCKGQDADQGRSSSLSPLWWYPSSRACRLQIGHQWRGGDRKGPVIERWGNTELNQHPVILRKNQRKYTRIVWWQFQNRRKVLKISHTKTVRTHRRRIPFTIHIFLFIFCI